MEVCKMSGFMIKTDQSAAVEMPVGEGFPKTGFIAPWVSQVMYRVGWYEVDLLKEQEHLAAELPSDAEGILETLTEGGVKPFDSRIASRAGDKFCYYFSDKDRAEALCEWVHLNEPKDWKPRPEQTWYFETQVDNICGLDEEAKGKFSGPVLSFDVRITTLRSKKYRHMYHLLALPAFVSAYGTAMGLPVHPFDLSPLTAPDDEVIFNAATELAWIGDSDSGYADAYFWQERVKVWNSLKEEDAENFHTKDAGTKYSVTSDNLDSILQATVRPWTEPVYARLIPVPDPRLGAAYERDGEKIRPSIPVIAQLFTSQEEAEKTAAEERSDSDGVVVTETKSAPESGGLSVPAAWASAEDAWVTQVKDIKGSLSGPPPTWAPQLDAIANKESLGYPLGATLDELTKWVNSV
jgi:hypothetical protein